ncbi:MAG: transglycosylase domain-containing protein [Actinomycetota bacterium]|nr:transglycosylase domain-containing protein [Actinomycetota bacterium]
MRGLGVRRSASYDDGFGAGREQPASRARGRGRLRLAKVVLAAAVLLAVAGGLLFVLTPSAGRATALTQAQAEEHHIAYPGPQVPQYFAEALVATEDHRFNTDQGVDPFAMARAAASWLTGRRDQGGSTIDQQLAKNLYTSGHSGFSQVLEQLALAVKLNMTYRRAEILQMYAEVAYYGHGYYGLGAASCGYFGRTPAELSLVQAAMLAGVVNAPTFDDPLVYPAQARARLVHVIGRMAAVGYLTPTSEAAALNASLDLSAVRGCP